VGKIFEENADQIIQRRKAFDASFDGSKTRYGFLTQSSSGATIR